MGGSLHEGGTNLQNSVLWFQIERYGNSIRKLAGILTLGNLAAEGVTDTKTIALGSIAAAAAALQLHARRSVAASLGDPHSVRLS